VNYWFGGFTNL